MESLSSEARGLRDIIAHHYFDVDASQILWIIKNELSPLKEAICFFNDNRLCNISFEITFWHIYLADWIFCCIFADTYVL
jgi:hypothetical protein